MTKTRDRKKKHNRKTKKNRKMLKIINMLRKSQIKVFIVKDRKGNIMHYEDVNPRVDPYIKQVIYSLQHPNDPNAMTGIILDDFYMTKQKKKMGGKRESKVEIFFFPSYLKQLKMQNDKQTNDNKYENFLIVNSSKYENFADFLSNKMEEVDNMFAFIKQERKSNSAKPTALYKHVVDFTRLNGEDNKPPPQKENVEIDTTE